MSVIKNCNSITITIYICKEDVLNLVNNIRNILQEHNDFKLSLLNLQNRLIESASSIHTTRRFCFRSIDAELILFYNKYIISKIVTKIKMNMEKGLLLKM